MLTYLPGFEEYVQEWFWERFKAELSVSLCSEVRLSEKDMSLNSFKMKIDQFNDCLERSKLTKFDKVMAKKRSPLFMVDYNEYNNGNCNVCKMNAKDNDSSINYEMEYGRDVNICSECYEQIKQIGTKLPDAKNKYLIITKSPYRGGIKLFGDMYMLFAKNISKEQIDAVEIVNIRDRESYCYQPIAGYVPMISENDIKIWKDFSRLCQHENDSVTYMGDLVKAGLPKTFRILAAESQSVTKNNGGKTKVQGKAFLGALKADVDNLGFLFSIGLKDYMSISRFAAMSRMFNHFFSDYMVRKIRTKYPNIYVVFAGGDDLFMLGPWISIVKFASEIRNDFGNFVGGNQEVTISGGISIAKPGIPVHTLTRQAEALLERSKIYESEHFRGKNAVTLFNTTVSWDAFHELVAMGDWIKDLIIKEKITIGLARRLLSYSEDHIAFKKKGEIKRGIYMSHMKYDFARNINPDQFTDKNEINRIYGLQNDHFFLENMRIPLSWALYQIRNE